MLLMLNGAWGQSGLNRHTVWGTDIMPWDDEDTVRLKRAKMYVAGLSGTEVADIADGLAYLKALKTEVPRPESPDAPSADPCERAKEKWAAGSAVFEECAHEFDGLNTVILALMNQTSEEARASARTESETFTYTYSKEAEAYTGDPDDFCYVRFTKQVLDNRPGDVIATSKAVGAKWERHAQARIIGHDEAQAYVDRQKRVSGGWMDDPAWKCFTWNFCRVLTATNSRKPRGSTPTTPAVVAA